jgi:hypothetical protein
VRLLALLLALTVDAAGRLAEPVNANDVVMAPLLRAFNGDTVEMLCSPNSVVLNNADDVNAS